MARSFTTRPEIRGTFGAVASTHWIASAVGFGILERGGNAFDAAVATGFTLQIVEPHLNGPGGEVPIIAHPTGADRPRVLCGQGVAPRAATIARLREMGITRMPGTGLVPAVVPGAFGAWMQLLLEHGTMRLRDVLEPAIGYARDGHPLVRRAAESIHAAAPLFRTEWRHSAEIWLPGGDAPLPGARVAQPRIAEAYSKILAEAEAAGASREVQIEAATRAFYQGFVAEAVDRFYRTEQADGSGARHPGLLAGEDMAAWRPTWEDTVSIDFAGVTVHKTGPWGQGPALLQALRILDAKGIAELEPGSAPWVHVVVETLKLSLADRDAWFGDPDYVDVPLDWLLSLDYAESRAAIIDDAASLVLRPGEPARPGVPRSGDVAHEPDAHSGGFGHDGRPRPGGATHGSDTYPGGPASHGTPGSDGVAHGPDTRPGGEPARGTGWDARDSAQRNRLATAPAVAALLALAAAAPEDVGSGGGEPTFADLPEVEGDTVQLDVADRWGNLVAATPSGGWLQGAPAVPGLGFNVTTRGQMFWLDERLPSHLAPGLRPRTTLTPTVLTRNGRPVAGLGSPGGDQQDQWTLGLLLRHLHQGLNLQAAIDAPLFHTAHYVGSFAPRAFTPGVVHVEERFPKAVRADLAERGHLLAVQPPWSLGRLCAAGFTRSGLVRAAATPRFMQAYAVGR